jgi:hypothetical protein
MAQQYILVVDGLDKVLSSLDELPANLIAAARMAVNDATKFGRKMAADKVLRAVALPADYVSNTAGRLHIKKFAKGNDLESIISARTRATSLARFATDTGNRAAGVGVEVKRGAAKRIKGAWLIKLKSGTADLDTKSNLGLAVRTKDGKRPPGYRPVNIKGTNIWLLYGPSVAQVLYSDKNQGGVVTEIADPIADKLEAEFHRQRARLNA